MDQLCGEEPVWDSDLVWYNNSWPQLTECFKNTYLQWMPCGCMMVMLSLHAWHMLSMEPVKAMYVSWVLLAKMVTSGLLLVMYFLEIFFNVVTKHPYGAIFLSDTLWILAMFLQILVIALERSRGAVTSPVLFVNWSLITVQTAFVLYSTLMLPITESDTGKVTLQILKFTLSLLLFIIICFADTSALDKNERNPEIKAGLLNWVLFVWMDSFIYRRYRNKLKEEDVFPLRPDNRCTRVIQKFIAFSSPANVKKRRHRVKNSFKDETIPLVSTATKPRGGQALLSVAEKAYENLPNAKGKEGQTEPNRISFFKAFVSCFWKEFVYCHASLVGFVAMQLLQPIFLGWLIDFTRSDDEPAWHGYALVCLFGTQVITGLLNTVGLYLTCGLAVRIRSTVIAAVFRKSLTISSWGRREFTSGQIVNLMSVDSEQLHQLIHMSFWVWMGPIITAVTVYQLFVYMGVLVTLVSGVSVILLVLVLNMFVARLLRRYQEQLMTAKDSRIKLISEILNGIKMIKLWGWEPKFIQKVEKVRNQELKVLMKCALCEVVNIFLWSGSQFWLIFFIMLTRVYVDDDHFLDAKSTFVSMNYIWALRSAISVMPKVTKEIASAATSFKRLDKFISTGDLEHGGVRKASNQSLAVNVVDGTFSWNPDSKEESTLKSINLQVTAGQLVAVVGSVGAGKSSLLSALLGEMFRLQGYANLNSTVAYVPQQAWIQNQSVRHNITFGRPMTFDFYKKVILACDLVKDLEMFPDYDKTEIGEKGINLSGGQKQRLSLARAVYSQADIYLLDDPLSAVDSQVGQHIFEHVLGPKGLLRNKTRIFVTHGLQWLRHADVVLVMKDGQISDTTTFDHLIGQNDHLISAYLRTCFDDGTDNIRKEENETKETSDIEYDYVKVEQRENDTANKIYMNRQKQEPKKREQETDDELDVEDTLKDKQVSFYKSQEELGSLASLTTPCEASRLTTDEELKKGKVSWSVYMALVESFGKRWAVVTLVALVCFRCIYVGSDFWLAKWNDDLELGNFTLLPANSTQRMELNNYYLSIYAVFGLMQTLALAIFAFIFQIRHVVSSRILHRRLLDSLMHARMSFYDTTPMGRILNRFSLDINHLDQRIFPFLEMVLNNSLGLFSVFAVMSSVIPQLLAVFIPMFVFFWLLKNFYVYSSRQLSRLSSTKRSPVYSHFSETLSGAEVIRAYRHQSRFIEESEEKIDDFQKMVCALDATNKWLNCRLIIMNCLVVLILCSVAVYLKGDITPGLIGLTVTYSLRITQIVSLTVRMFGEMETSIVSVERIDEYCQVDSEAAWDTPRDKDLVSDWPKRGDIQIVHYSTRYRDGLDCILRDFSCNIRAGEKVGVVGRTGAGKSSLVLALLRILEPSSGHIYIDGEDITNIGLHRLRNRITVLPQEPVLFAGTIRDNLDIDQTHSDLELWTALEHAHLRSFVEELPERLDHQVGEEGGQLSVGQRQLLCLARSLLKDTRILILDEATAAVDMHTDELIQQTIRTDFAHCTVIAIAHRLNTVMDYDRILVMDLGRAAEYDSPQKLLANPNSLFYSLAAEAGIVS